MKKIILSTFLLSLSLTTTAQQSMTAEDAVALGLESNFDIKIARQVADNAKINNTAGNAGMLPNITLNASDNYSLNNFRQKLANGTENSSTSAGGNSFNTNIALAWTVYDGKRMFIAKNRLATIEEQGELNFKNQVLQTTAQILLAYYDIVRQKQLLKSINEIIAFNEERVRLFDTRFQSGLSPKTDLLQAKVDLNVQKENALLQQRLIADAKRRLNSLLSREPNEIFEVQDSIPLEMKLLDKKIGEKLAESNPNLLALKKQILINDLLIKEAESQKKPRITLNLAYSFNRIDNAAGFILNTQTFGPQGGLVFSLPIYQGKNIQRQIKSATIDRQIATLQFDRQKNTLQTQLQNAVADVETQEQLLKIEEENTKLAKENLDLSLMRLRLGQTNSLEVRQAQTTYEAALTRLTNFRYNLKAAEITLKQLLGEL